MPATLLSWWRSKWSETSGEMLDKTGTATGYPTTGEVETSGQTDTEKEAKDKNTPLQSQSLHPPPTHHPSSTHTHNPSPNPQPAERGMQVDGCWGWVVVMSSFLISAVVDGVGFSVGIFFSAFQTEFGSNKHQTSWVSSVLNGTYLLIGPLVSVFINRYGCRKVAILGCLVASLAFCLGTFSPSIEVLIATYGFLGGVGLGFLYQPSVVIVGYYFHKRRALALGITCCGSGFGAIAFAPLFHFFLNTYNWKTATYLIAAMVLLCICACATFRPLQSQHLMGKKPSDIKLDQKSSIESFEMSIIIQASESKRSEIEEELLKRNGRKESATDENKTVSMSKSCLSQQPEVSKGTDEMNRVGQKQNGTSVTEVSRSERDSKTGEVPRKENGDETSESDANQLYKDKNLNRKSDSSLLSKLSKIWPKTGQVPPKENEGETSRTTANRLFEDKNLNRQSDASIVSKFSKGSSKSVNNVVKPVGDVSEPDAQYDYKSAKRTSLFQRQLNNLVWLPMRGNLNPLTRVSFLLYGMACFLMSVGMYVPTTFLPIMSEELNIESSKAALLISKIGLGNLIARLLAGFIADRYHRASLPINNAALVIGGLATCVTPLIKNYVLMMVNAFIFGVSVGVFVTVQVVILIELLGLHRLTAAFGLANMYHGIGTFVGPPLAGYIWDSLHDVRYAFYVIGGIVTLAGVICFPLRLVSVWEKRHPNRFCSETQWAPEKTAHD